MGVGSVNKEQGTLAAFFDLPDRWSRAEDAVLVHASKAPIEQFDDPHKQKAGHA